MLTVAVAVNAETNIAVWEESQSELKATLIQLTRSAHTSGAFKRIGEATGNLKLLLDSIAKPESTLYTKADEGMGISCLECEEESYCRVGCTSALKSVLRDQKPGTTDVGCASKAKAIVCRLCYKRLQRKNEGIKEVAGKIRV